MVSAIPRPIEHEFEAKFDHLTLVLYKTRTLKKSFSLQIFNEKERTLTHKYFWMRQC